MAQVKWTPGDDRTIVVGTKNWCVGCSLNNGVTLEHDDVAAHEATHDDFNKAAAPAAKAKKQ